MTSFVVLILTIALLVMLSGYLSVGEAAISSVSAAKAQTFGEDNPKMAPLVDWELAERQKVIIAILVAHNLFSVAASSFATVLTTNVWGEKGVFWATVIMTVLMVLFADFLPKCIGMALGERNFNVVLPGLRAVSVVFRPLIWILEKIVAFFSDLFHVDMTLESAVVTRDEIEQLVKNGEESGAIEASERRMIDGVIAFDETRVSEIMVPRVSMDALEVNETIAGVASLMQNWEHSRIPVFRETPDDIVGVVYLKDMIPYLRAGKMDTPLSAFMRRALFVPETMKVADLFGMMRGKHVHFAVVVDEYGGTAGIVTLEDLLEEIVGDIRDEYDEESVPIVQLNENSYRVKCTESLEDLGAVVGYDFDCNDVDSVGGYVLDKFMGFPEKGDIYRDDDWTIKVTDVGEHRVNEVIFTRSAHEVQKERHTKAQGE
ncbi:hemolysin family protein [Pyramidobacter piscolens]|uniref:hemolysin family protein n=1 Tax=Pyramidobacter piscolens TaxID=638849 RepID=UPI002AAFE84F|nr:hemolysin family protein [Pyramidobacter piscolens]